MTILVHLRLTLEGKEKSGDTPPILIPSGNALSRLLLRSQPAGAAPRQALRPGPAFPTSLVVCALDNTFLNKRGMLMA